MKVLVIGGMHGNEPLGPAVVALFQKNPINNVDALLANQQAIDQNCRFIEQDLNRSFPGDSNGVNYESKRAAELLVLTEQYDLVLDFHNTHCPDNDCGFVGDDAPRLLYDQTRLLGLDRIIVADYDCINKYASNCVSIEISLNSQLNQADIWYERISQLAQRRQIDTQSDVTTYRFVYRMTLEDKVKYRLDQQDLRAFQPMPATLARHLGVMTPAYPIFIGDEYTPYNYGGVLNKIEKTET